MRRHKQWVCISAFVASIFVAAYVITDRSVAWAVVGAAFVVAISTVAYLVMVEEREHAAAPEQVGKQSHGEGDFEFEFRLHAESLAARVVQKDESAAVQAEAVEEAEREQER